MMGQEEAKEKRVLVLASVASMIDQFNMPNIHLLIGMGYEVHVACNFEEGNTCDAVHIRKFKHELGKQGIICHQWDCPRNAAAVRKCLRALVQLWRLMGTYRFVMVHCHSPVGGVLARIAAHFRRIFVIYTAHGFHFYKGAPVKNWLLYYPVEKLLSYWTDVLVAINKEDYAFAKRHLKARKVYRIPGVGIHTARFAARDEKVRKAFRKRYGIAQDAVLLLSAGELNKGKNHRMILEAAAGIQKKNPNQDPNQDVCCLICGIGRLHSQLKWYANKLGIGGQVFLPGYVEDMEAAYAAADIFVFPSRREGMPVALMEAMAAGLPVIASDIRGCSELVDDPAGGYLLPPDDTERFTEAVAKLVQWNRKCPKRLETMGRHNQEQIKDFDCSCVNQKMRRIYRYCEGRLYSKRSE